VKWRADGLERVDLVYVTIGIAVWFFMYIIGRYSVSMLGFVRG
jgi:hypothetical protein